MKQFHVGLKPKGSQLFTSEVIEAENLKQATEKANALIKNFKTKDKELEKFIEKCDGLEAVITPL